MLGKFAVWQHQCSPCLPMLMSSKQMSRPGPSPARLLHKTGRKHVVIPTFPSIPLVCCSLMAFQIDAIFPCKSVFYSWTVKALCIIVLAATRTQKAVSLTNSVHSQIPMKLHSDRI